jgi:hypothetical protein
VGARDPIQMSASFVYVNGLMWALLLRVRLRRRSGPSALLIAIVGLMVLVRRSVDGDEFLV